MLTRRKAIAAQLVKQFITGQPITWDEVEAAIKAMKGAKP